MISISLKTKLLQEHKLFAVIKVPHGVGENTL